MQQIKEDIVVECKQAALIYILSLNSTISKIGNAQVQTLVNLCTIRF